MSKVTIKGQAHIPKPIREFLGVIPGKSEVEFIVVDGVVQLVNKTNFNPFAALRGITKNKLSTDEIMEMTRG